MSDDVHDSKERQHREEPLKVPYNKELFCYFGEWFDDLPELKAYGTLRSLVDSLDQMRLEPGERMGYCNREGRRAVAVGTKEGTVLVWEDYQHKPVEHRRPVNGPKPKKPVPEPPSWLLWVTGDKVYNARLQKPLPMLISRNDQLDELLTIMAGNVQ